MLDWEDLRHFVAVSTAGSIASAARGLRVDPATVGRRIRALEAALQVQLIERLPRRCVLTGAGRLALPWARQMAASASALEQAVRDVKRAAPAAAIAPLAGRVVVSAAPVLVAQFLAGTSREFASHFPGLGLSLIADPQTFSQSLHGADVAVRLLRPHGAEMVSRRIGMMEFGMYAAPAYLQGCDASKWEFIAYGTEYDHASQEAWIARVAGRRAVSLRVSDLASQRAAAVAGAGVAILPRFLAQGMEGLAPLAEVEPFYRDIWLVVHREQRERAPVRAAMEFIERKVQETPGPVWQAAPEVAALVDEV